MKLMLSVQGKSLDNPVNARFGRSPYFLEFDTDTEKWTAHDNPAQSQSGGAGVAAAQFLIDHTVDVAISGRFGPNAHSALAAAGIQMMTFEGEGQTAREVIDAYKQGGLTPSK
jgi:predicted Fe-Mo cluster-binding NifX family protein